MKTWKQIWENRKTESISTCDKHVLIKLIKADGFDGGGGDSKIAPESWMAYISLIKKELSMQESDSLFEVGCGCGAILYSFYISGHQVGGLDFSEALITKAKELLPDANLITCEASDLKTVPMYDYVVANSSFSYFSDFDYAASVLEKMYHKAKKGLAILDIPDAQTKDVLEEKRCNACVNYDEKYKGLHHLYYPQKWFLEFAEQKQCSKITLGSQNIANYGYNGLRFNCFLLK